MASHAQLLAEYLRVHKALVEPRQGWSSLASPLHLAYSMGRKRSFTDLGTYVAKPLDHGGRPGHRGNPAWAFDLGHPNFKSRGWRFLVARRFVRKLWKNRVPLNIEYIILGDKIISRNHPYWRYYGPDRSHFYHIHVSGHWPGR
jgi:hypothetical protein